jgi:hypothetical protein
MVSDPHLGQIRGKRVGYNEYLEHQSSPPDPSTNTKRIDSDNNSLQIMPVLTPTKTTVNSMQPTMNHGGPSTSTGGTNATFV